MLVHRRRGGPGEGGDRLTGRCWRGRGRRRLRWRRDTCNKDHNGGNRRDRQSLALQSVRPLQDYGLHLVTVLGVSSASLLQPGVHPVQAKKVEQRKQKYSPVQHTTV